MSEAKMSLDDETEEVFYFCSSTEKTKDSLSGKIVKRGMSKLLAATFDKENETSEDNPFKLEGVSDEHMKHIFAYLKTYENKEEVSPPMPADSKKSIDAILGDVDAKLFAYTIDPKKSSKDNMLTAFVMAETIEWMGMIKYADKLSCIIAKYMQGKDIEVIKSESDYIKKSMKELAKSD